jgi:hypothetical protein
VVGELFIFGIALLILFSVPMITGSYARTKGRRYWVWFFISMVLPLIATFIISALPDLSENKKGDNNKHKL